MPNDLALLGFSPHESAVYENLVLEGPTTLATLAKRVKRHRPTVDVALKSLEKRTCVFRRTVGKRTIFVASSPAVLRGELNTKSQEGLAAIAELERAHSRQSDAFQVRTIEGREALRNVFLEMVERLGKEDVFYRYIACGDPTDVEPYVHPKYREVRDKKNIQQLAITSAAMKGRPFKKGMGCLWKVVPPNEDAFEYGIAQLIFGSTVAFLDYTTESAIIIEGTRFAKYQAALHRVLYARLSDRVV